MKLAPPPGKYAQEYQNRLNRELSENDRYNLKRGQRIQASDGTEFVLVSPDGTRFRIDVANDGTLSTTEL